MLLELLNVVGSLVIISMREVILYGEPEISADRGRLARGRIGTVILVNVELFVVENVADVWNFLEGLIEQLLEVELNQLVRDPTGLRRRPRRILSTSDARGDMRLHVERPRRHTSSARVQRSARYSILCGMISSHMYV